MNLRITDDAPTGKNTYQQIILLRFLRVDVTADRQEDLEGRVFSLEVGNGPVVGVRAVYVQILVQRYHFVRVGVNASIPVYQVAAEG